MGFVKGGFLRLFQTFLYALAFCCAAIILGIYSYFLAVLADRDLPIAKDWRAVEGLSGAAVLYTILAILLTCCLAGVTFFSFLGLVLDVLFIGAMIAVAVLTREGVNSCSGSVKTPLGSGPSNSGDSGYGADGFGFGSGKNATYAPNLGLACKLNKAAFAVSIAGAVIFLITALMQIVLSRQHKKESRYGPSPANNYTSGTTNQKFWQRKPKATTEKDAELGAVGTGAGLAVGSRAADLRPSHDTAYTGSTVAAPNAANAFNNKELETGPHAPHSQGYNPPPHSHDEYYNTPTTGVVNPYGYENPQAKDL